MANSVPNSWEVKKPPDIVSDRSYAEIISEANRKPDNVMEIFFPKGANVGDLRNFPRELFAQIVFIDLGIKADDLEGSMWDPSLYGTKEVSFREGIDLAPC